MYMAASKKKKQHSKKNYKYSLEKTHTKIRWATKGNKNMHSNFP